MTTSRKSNSNQNLAKVTVIGSTMANAAGLGTMDSASAADRMAVNKFQVKKVSRTLNRNSVATQGLKTHRMIGAPKRQRMIGASNRHQMKQAVQNLNRKTILSLQDSRLNKRETSAASSQGGMDIGAPDKTIWETATCPSKVIYNC